MLNDINNISSEELLKLATDIFRQNPTIARDYVKVVLGRNPVDQLLLAEAQTLFARACIFIGDAVEGEAMARVTLELALSIGSREFEGKAHNNIGVFRFIQRDFDGALSHYARAEMIYLELGDEDSRMKVYFNVGNIMNRKGNFVAAMNEYERVLEYATRVGDIELEAKSLSSISSLYHLIHDNEEGGIELLVRSVELHEKIGDNIGIFKSLSNLGNSYTNNGNYDKARECLSRARSIALEVRLMESMINTYFSLVELELLCDNQERVDEILAEAAENVDKTIGLNAVLLAMLRCKVFHARNQFEAAYNEVIGFEEEVNTIDDFQYRHSYNEAMYECCYNLGRYEEAINYLKITRELEQRESVRLSEQRLMNARVKAELEAAQTKAEIERLKSLDLEKLVRQLEDLHEENADYLAFMAHELKSPLHTIRSISQLLLDEPQMEDFEKEEFYKNILELSSRMAQHINRELSRAEGKREIVHEINARPILTYVINSSQFRAREKNISLVGTIDRVAMNIIADERMLISIMENLISNALKFSNEGTRVEATARCLPLGNPTRLLISVADEGPGLSAHDMEGIFTPFGKLSAKPTSGEDSSGIGLHYVKKLVEDAKGRIWCESKTGQGATFFVELPLAHTVPLAEQSTQTATTVVAA